MKRARILEWKTMRIKIRALSLSPNPYTLKTKRNFPLRPFDIKWYVNCVLKEEHLMSSIKLDIKAFVHPLTRQIGPHKTFCWVTPRRRWEKMKLLRYAFVFARARTLAAHYQSDNNSLIHQNIINGCREISLSRNISSVAPSDLYFAQLRNKKANFSVMRNRNRLIFTARFSHLLQNHAETRSLFKISVECI